MSVEIEYNPRMNIKQFISHTLIALMMVMVSRVLISGLDSPDFVIGLLMVTDRCGNIVVFIIWLQGFSWRVVGLSHCRGAD